LLAACRIFLGAARGDGCEEAKARFNANQQQKIAKAQPSGAFKEGGKFDLQKTSKIQIE